MSDDADIRVQLAAYLAGELDDDAVDQLEDRMRSEPWVAETADRMADMLVELGAVDDVAPPEGYGDRLREAVAYETGTDLSTMRHLGAAGAAAATGWADRPGGARRDGAGGRHRWTRLQQGLAVAAGVVVLAVAGVGVLGSSGFLSSGGDDQVARDEADDAAAGFADATARDGAEGAEGGAAEEAAELEADTAGDATVQGDAAQDDTTLSVPAPAAEGTEAAAAATDTADAATTDAEDSSPAAATGPAPASGRPAVLDLGELSEDALRRQVGAHPATQDLYGTDAARAPELADAYRDELLRGPGWADGTPAGVCLAEVLQDAGEGLVPAVAARGLLDGAEVIAYGLVRSGEAQALDRTDVWVLDPDTCDVRRVLSAPSE